MATDKKINYAIQGGGPNYLGKQKMVTAPKKWKSSPKHPTAHLAYITKKEQDLLIKKDLYGSLKGKPNRGPSGIVSLQGDLGGYDASPGGPNAGGGAGGKGSSARDKQRAADIMTGRVSVSSPTGDTAGYRGRAPTGRNQYGDFVGPGQSRFGGLGGLLRGALGVFGGIPGRIFSALSNAKNWAKNKGQVFGEEVEEFGNYPTLDRYLNRNTDKYKDKPYLGQGQSNYSFDGPTEGNDLGLYTNTLGAPIGPGLRVSEDPNRFQNTNITGGTNVNDFQGVNFNDQIEGTDNIANLIQNSKNNLSPSFQDGGRAGFRNGEFLDEDINVEGPNFDFNENIEMAETSPFEIRIEELMDEGMSWQEAYQIASQEFGQIAEGESDQGIASLV